MAEGKMTRHNHMTARRTFRNMIHLVNTNKEPIADP
jgi:hypothetical protein